jgi:hypothetical protein
VLPAAWVGWAVAVVAAAGVHGVIEAFCPAEQLVSGVCLAPWAPYAEKAIICAGAGLAAALVVLLTTLVAPAHRGAVALLAFAAGCLVALYMAVLVGAYAELATAVSVGFLVTWWLRTRPWGRPPAGAPTG